MEMLLQRMTGYIKAGSYNFQFIGKVYKIFQDKIKLITKQTEPLRKRFNFIKWKQRFYISKTNRQKAVEVMKDLKQKVEIKENFIRQIVIYKEKFFIEIFNGMYAKVFADQKSEEKVSDQVKRCLIQDKIMGKVFW